MYVKQPQYNEYQYLLTCISELTYGQLKRFYVLEKENFSFNEEVHFVFFVVGKVISQKKDELNHILDQFNIQVNYSCLFSFSQSEIRKCAYVIDVRGKNPLMYGDKQQQIQAITCMFYINKLELDFHHSCWSCSKASQATGP